MCKSQPTDDELSLIGAWSGHVTHYKFCTRVGSINSNNRMAYYQQKGRGYGYVTVLTFCRLSWCSVSRGFVSDSWGTCLYLRSFLKHFY